MIPSLTFLSPIWLAAGAGAALLPVLAHLLSLRRPRRVEFPAARFVRAALLATTRRTRPRDALLLALRVLVILLLACAFADPMLSRSSPVGEPASMRPMDTVIIIDASASMQRLRGGASLFEHARTEARRILENLDPSHDRAAIVLSAGRPTTLLPRLTASFSALQRELARIEPTLELGNSQAALDVAASLLSPASERPARVIVLSDFQTSQWSGTRSEIPIEALRLTSDSPSQGASVDSISLSETPSPNGAAIHLFVTITNHDPIERSVPVALASPFGNSVALLTLGAGSSGIAALDLRPAASGLAEARVSIPADEFPYDDLRYAVLNTRRSPGAAVITAADVHDFSRGAAWVQAALVAASDAADFQSATPLRPPGLAGSDLLRFDAVALVECGALDDATIRAVLQRLRGGGDVLWFLDSEESGGSLYRLLQRAAIVSRASPLAPRSHELLTIAEFPSKGIPRDWLSSATVAAPIPLAAIDGDQRIATLSDGSPFVARVAIGSAHLTIVRADLAHEASTLASSGVLAAVLDALTHSAGPQAAQSTPVGDPIIVSLNTAAISPATIQVDSLGRPVRREDRGDTTLAYLDALPAPGIVSLADADARVIAMRAVNLDPRESDTQSLTADQLRSLSGSAAKAEEVALMAANGDGDALPLWSIAMALALALLAAESWLLWATGRAPASNPEVAP